MSFNELELFEQRASMAEDEINILKKELNSLLGIVKSGNFKVNEEDGTVSKAELEELKNENEKLKYRIEFLKRTLCQRKSQHMAVANENSDYMISIYNTLSTLFETAITEVFPDLTDPPVDISMSNNPKFGDYQCNSALPICKLLSTLNKIQEKKKISPKEIAENIAAKVSSSSIIEKLDVAPNGFINIYLKREFGQNAFNNILTSEKVSVTPLQRIRKVIIDFSSPNVAKEMHVGHLRSTIIGDSIARLLEYLGHEVLRLNHVGDWGTQFGMLITHLEDKFPNYCTESPPISDLQGFYKESKVLFDNDEEFKKRAYANVVKLQAHDPKIIQGWKLICDVSRKEFENIYERLDIKLIERGESFYQKPMEEIVKELEEKGFLEEDEGRKIMWGEKKEGIPLTIVKRDGGFTYDTSDMAAIKHRIFEEGGDWVIYVVDAGQAVHFQVIESCAKRASILTHQRMDFVGFGVVLGEDKKKFKTRSGDTIKLCDLLDEGLKRAEEKLKEKERDKVLTKEEFDRAKESVAYGCIKYADLCHDRNKDYIFSFDRMLSDKGNTAVYLLYALTRIRSIARTANVSREQIKQAIGSTPISLDHEKEWKLAKVLLRFPDVIAKVTKELSLHCLCDYCYEVAGSFTEFYDNCYCVEKNQTGEIVKVNMGRIMLTEVTAMMLEQCFSLLGLKPVEKM